MNILEKIKNRRIDKDISKTQMGLFLNMTYQNYTKIEDGINNLRLDTFLQICKILDINPMTLINDTNTNYILLTEEDLNKLDQAEEVIEKIKKQSSKATQQIKIENNENGQIIIGNNIHDIKK